MLIYFKDILRRWKDEEHALAAVEAAMIFPVMLIMLMSIYDFGFAILANQKAVRASQVVADLVTRENTISANDLDEAIEAGRLVFEPLNHDSYGVDIVSIRFDEDADTEIVWRETLNMGSLPDALSAVSSLATEDDGVVMVTVNYQFEPVFANFIIEEFGMSEVAFSRGRTTAVITLE